jgi:hypothetical protein
MEIEMDWLEEFYNKFKRLEWIKNLKKRKFIGSVKINFFKGEVMKANRTISAPGKETGDWVSLNVFIKKEKEEKNNGTEICSTKKS